MDTTTYVLETIAHFAKRTDGPPPNVPLRQSPTFETHLASVCVDQHLSPTMFFSLEQLALPQAISRVTAMRLKQHARELESDTRRRLALLARLVGWLDAAGVPSLVIGDAWSAVTSYEQARLKPVGRLDLVIEEDDCARAVSVLRDKGMMLPAKHPVLGPGRVDPRELVRFHHYIAPLVMVAPSGDRVRIRFRVVDVGHPGPRETAWDRASRITIDGKPVDGVCAEDQLIHSLIEFGVSGCWRLGALMDAAMLVHRGGQDIDWAYVARRTREVGVYPAFFFAFERMCRLLNLPRALDNLPAPASLGLWALGWWWRPETIDYLNEPRATAGRFKFGLFACGSPLSRLRWVWRHVMVRRRWVERYFGGRWTPWRYVKFIVLVKEYPFSSPPYTKRIALDREEIDGSA